MEKTTFKRKLTDGEIYLKRVTTGRDGLYVSIPPSLIKEMNWKFGDLIGFKVDGGKLFISRAHIVLEGEPEERKPRKSKTFFHDTYQSYRCGDCEFYDGQECNQMGKRPSNSRICHSFEKK